VSRGGARGYAALLEAGRRFLAERGAEDAARDAVELLCLAAGCDRARLYAYPDESVPDAAAARFRDFLHRRARHEPIQYIAGTWEFMGLTFRVDRSVLIPRPDTECLAECVLRAVRARAPGEEPPRILDLCTGSGCVAVCLAFFLRSAHIVATDISAAALALARENAALNGLADRLTFLEGDLFAALPNAASAPRFDVICANPPYIPEEEIPGLMPDVRLYEPELALNGGPDGLGFYRRIAEGAPRYLRPGGTLAVEVGAGQAADVAAIFAGRAELTAISTVRDLSGLERVVFARRALTGALFDTNTCLV
jgi:release factor glutamine methyltransferase